MTIALGILASDGIVIAGDNEISVGKSKLTDTKLIAVSHELYGKPAVIGVGGAGALGYFQSIGVRVAKLIATNAGSDPFGNAETVRSNVEKFMTAFYNKHVIPWKGKRDCPTIDILAGCWTNGCGMLWATELAACRMLDDPVNRNYDAIGVGAAHARELLHPYAVAMPSDSAVLLACYVMHRVKDYVSFCGKDTEVQVLTEGSLEPKALTRDLVMRCQNAFEDYGQILVSVFHFITGLHGGRMLGDQFQKARTTLDDLRQEIRATISSTPHT